MSAALRGEGKGVGATAGAVARWGAKDGRAVRKGWAEPTFAAGRRVAELQVPVLCVAGTADLRVPAADEARRFEREV